MKKKLIAEFMATYFLIFIDTGAIIVNGLTNNLGPIGVSLSVGLIVMASIYAFGHISGAHINPAVTIGFLINGDILLKQAVYYICVQFLAGVTASYSLLLIFGNVGHLGATVPLTSCGQALAIEFIVTFILMMIILSSAIHGKAIKSFSGITIGATVSAAALFAGPISGASMNPARSFAPAMVSGIWESQWIYFVGPITGAIFAAYIYQYIHGEK